MRGVRALAAALLLAACGGVPDAADGRTRLRVVVQPYLVFAPLHVAQAEGLFAAHGLDVELVPMAGSEQAIPLLIDGGIDVLPGHAAPGLLNAMARVPKVIARDRGTANARRQASHLGIRLGAKLLG